ncbi:MAG: nuclear transport factor 2 family protein, partial [Chthoniobacterales bacterium]
MMKSWMLALLIPLMLFSPTVRADDLRAEMEGSNKQWLEAFNTPSIASFPAMYTEDAILIPGGMAPAVPGPEAITKFWEGSIRAGFKDHTFEIVETRADGNLAYVLS